eukprot:GFUD01088335.1.p1 GENE.GFUD01088335.1~~GFUD01088335.1.p1  ORF type:complete len:461 (-),score=78.87 GFUD01088335.1:34-1416(-)
MLLRSARLGLFKPQYLSVMGSTPIVRNFSVKKPASKTVLINCPQIGVLNFSPQLRYLSISGHRFNTSPEITREILDEVLESVVASVEKTEAVVNNAAASNELIFQIPEKPQVVPDTVSTSSSEAVAGNELVFDIPEKPIPIDLPEWLGEPAFDTLGLASWWPSGRMQYLMENIHIGLDMEWWQTIAITTLMMRCVLFPVVVIAQRNMANMNNNSPGMAKLQEKMSDARRRGDLMESAMLGQELQAFMSKKGINPVKNAVPLFLQVPVFMSFFFGLRGMAYTPVESLSTGGILWFENLTICDPFYLLPLLTSATLFLQLRLGAEGAKLDQMGPKMKLAMTVMPFMMLPITINFPCAVTFYWFTTNIISLCQAQVLKIPYLRKTLNIPIMIKHDTMKTTPGGKKKGFQESFRDTIDNWKVQGSIIDRRAYDEQQFRDAGAAKPTKTFKYDPTRPIALKQNKK